jgi:hypothetical protein
MSQVERLEYVPAQSVKEESDPWHLDSAGSSSHSTVVMGLAYRRLRLSWLRRGDLGLLLLLYEKRSIHACGDAQLRVSALRCLLCAISDGHSSLRVHLAMITSPESAASHVRNFVVKVSSDPGFRRQLFCNPSAELENLGFTPGQVPSTLRIQGYEQSTALNEATLLEFLTATSISNGSMVPPLEFRLVAYGVRRLALLHCPEADAVALAAWAIERGKAALLSPFECTPATEKNKGGYSNLVMDRRPARIGSGAWRAVLIAQDWNHVALACLALLFGWQWYLGRLLEYPECCVKAFLERWPEARDRHQGDVARVLLADHGGGPFVGSFHWGANVFARYSKISLISYFPCRLECQATCLLAESQLAALAAFEPEVAQHLKAMLSAPLLFTEDAGVFIFPGADICLGEHGCELLYDRTSCLATTVETDLAKAILEGRQLMADSAVLTVGAQPFEGRLFLFDDAGPSRAGGT